MVELSNSFRSIRPFKALVIGDFLLDTYTTGRVKRISPEAPVPIMEVFKQESRPGGAGNVVFNLMTLGAEVFAVGRLGADGSGDELKKHLHGANLEGLVVEPNYRTPVKNRLISDSQQLLRVDQETISPLVPICEQEVAALLETIVSSVQVIAVSDYGKGFLTTSLLHFLIALAKKQKIPLIIDPKGADFLKYRGANVIKPNLAEAYAAAKLPMSATLDEVAHILLRETDADLVVITRSEAGISSFEKSGQRTDFPVRTKEVKDVTGAGDTVLATLCLAMASNLSMAVGIQLANIAATISIERLGCVQVTLPEIARRLLELDVGTKIYDENHMYVLCQVLKNRCYTLLVVNQQAMKEMSFLFRTIRKLSCNKDSELIIYVEASCDDEGLELLSSLSEVDFIIIQQTSLECLLESVHPKEIYVAESAAPIESKELLSGLLARLADRASAKA